MAQKYELDPNLAPKVDHAARLVADEVARQRRARKKDIRLLREGEDTHLPSREKASIVSKFSEAPGQPKPYLGEHAHIDSEWDGSRLLIEKTPMTDAEFDLAWTEAPIKERAGDSFEFGASEIEEDAIPVKGIILNEGVEEDPFDSELLFNAEYGDPFGVVSLDALGEKSERSQDGHLPGSFADYGATRLDQSN